jgi:hypothetical protein
VAGGGKDTSESEPTPRQTDMTVKRDLRMLSHQSAPKQCLHVNKVIKNAAKATGSVFLGTTRNMSHSGMPVFK